jgi:hypothetical protein
VLHAVPQNVLHDAEEVVVLLLQVRTHHPPGPSAEQNAKAKKREEKKREESKKERRTKGGEGSEGHTIEALMLSDEPVVSRMAWRVLNAAS